MRSIRFILLLCMLSLLAYTSLYAASASDPRRGVQIAPKHDPSLDSLYNQSYAVIIGINQYEKWPSLEYAVNDARSIQKRLKEMGFDTITLLDNNATRENILKVLGDELPQRVQKNDRVIIFYAGHGQTEELTDGSQMGYIVPVDSDTRNIFSTAISMDQVRQFSRRLPAKHVLYLIDACYSGLGLTRSGGIPPSDRNYLTKITTKKAHQMLTAGGKGEQAHEDGGHGVFTKYLLEGLDGSADREDKGYITFSDLASYVKPKVTRETRNSQIPQYGNIDGEGEFVFVLTKAAPMPTDTPIMEQEPVTPKPERIGPVMPKNFEKVKSAVVNISTDQAGQQTKSTKAPFPNDEFFKQFFGDASTFVEAGPKDTTVGSGFIISVDGYILTNNHIVVQAGKVLVRLVNGTTYEAKVIGRDAATDIALIKIHPDSPIGVLDVGDSEKIHVGDRVVAVGSPSSQRIMSYTGTVTARGRGDFIQTSFAINQGISGGPLLNMKGQVIGINTAIDPQTKGIGFAIPINMAKAILPKLKSKGKVTRGWLGVSVQDVTEDVAKSLQLKDTSGALISEVIKGAPADNVGLRSGDLITEINRKKIKDTHDLLLTIASFHVGDSIEVKVLRDGQEKTVNIAVTESNDRSEIASSSGSADNFGMTVQNIKPGIAKRYGVEGTGGVIVVNVNEGSQADLKGIRPQDIILQVNKVKISSVEDYMQKMSKVNAGYNVLLLIKRGKAKYFVSLRK
jgi:serine protease Do